MFVRARAGVTEGENDRVVCLNACVVHARKGSKTVRLESSFLQVRVNTINSIVRDRHALDETSYNPASS